MSYGQKGGSKGTSRPSLELIVGAKPISKIKKHSMMKRAMEQKLRKTIRLRRKDKYLHHLVKTLIRDDRPELLQDILSKHNIELEKRDKRGNTFLNLACQSGNYKIIKMLILSGAVLDTQDNEGNTPLHHAYTYKFDS